MASNFEPEGHFGEIPYQVQKDGSILVDISGRILTYKTFDDFIDNAETDALREAQTPTAAALALTAEEPPKSNKKQSKGCGCLVLIGIAVLFAIFASGNNGGSNSTSVTSSHSYTAPSRSYSSSGSDAASILNAQFGRVCRAQIEGFFSNTLRIDWTSSTTKLNAITVLAAVGNAKETLYSKGIRYFKFPNNSGTYNVIDWKTGEKSSVNESATYHFND